MWPTVVIVFILVMVYTVQLKKVLSLSAETTVFGSWRKKRRHHVQHRLFLNVHGKMMILDILMKHMPQSGVIVLQIHLYCILSYLIILNRRPVSNYIPLVSQLQWLRMMKQMIISEHIELFQHQ